MCIQSVEIHIDRPHGSHIGATCILVYFSNLAYLLILILTTPISDNKKADLLPTAAEIVHVDTTWIQSVESHID